MSLLTLSIMRTFHTGGPDGTLMSPFPARPSRSPAAEPGRELKADPGAEEAEEVWLKLELLRLRRDRSELSWEERKLLELAPDEDAIESERTRKVRWVG